MDERLRFVARLPEGQKMATTVPTDGQELALQSRDPNLASRYLIACETLAPARTAGWPTRCAIEQTRPPGRVALCAPTAHDPFGNSPTDG